uniref:Uncharacterized protein n=1 Tax=Lactuca sativa TaxID=4236 RepID=A0A9R1WFS5_LACSA|nr:hypothetical protein LSAT_V11C200086680 [Lactuca sativa]
MLQATSIAAPLEDFMDIGDPTLPPHNRPLFSLFPYARDININPFSLLDVNFTRSIFNSGPGFRGSEPFLSHPREVRQIPIEVEDGPKTCAHVIIDDDDFPTSLPSCVGLNTRLTASAPRISDSPDHGIEEEMIRAAIEASKQDSHMVKGKQLEDPELAQAVSLSLKCTHCQHQMEDVEDQPLVRNMIRFMVSTSIDFAKDKYIEEVNLISPSSPRH